MFRAKFAKNMKTRLLIFSAAIFLISSFSTVAQPKPKSPPKTILSEWQDATAPTFEAEVSPELQSLINKIVTVTVKEFAAKGLNEQNLALTLLDLRDAASIKQAAFHGENKIYPASVVKLFYLAAAHRWLEDQKIKSTPELERGLRDMIVDSSNDATGYIVDVLSGVSSGAELNDKDFLVWATRREAVQRYFDSLGYANINLKQKTFCEDAYGREQQFRGKDGINRNKLTTNATARLLAEIVLKKSVTPERSQKMLDLLKRDWEAKGDSEDQARGFTGIALPKGAKLWSKAGYTSKTRHDAAYVETPDGQKFVLVIFTENVANEREIIPYIARQILSEIGKTK